MFESALYMKSVSMPLRKGNQLYSQLTDLQDSYLVIQVGCRKSWLP